MTFFQTFFRFVSCLHRCYLVYFFLQVFSYDDFVKMISRRIKKDKSVVVELSVTREVSKVKTHNPLHLNKGAFVKEFHYYLKFLAIGGGRNVVLFKYIFQRFESNKDIDELRAQTKALLLAIRFKGSLQKDLSPRASVRIFNTSGQLVTKEDIEKLRQEAYEVVDCREEVRPEEH